MSPEATARIARILPLFLLLLPFAVFWWMVPGLGGSSLGNDYFQYAIDNQQELLYSLEHGTFPLFCAGFVEGHSCAALTLGQLYHPMPHLAARLPGYWRGHALLLNTLLRLLELGVAQTLLFLFFKRARVGAATAFVASFAAVYNLRMLDMFRYGASLENYAAFVSLCALMGLHHLDRQSPWLPVAMAAASYALFVGGHPQFMYFGLLGAAFVALILPLWLTDLRAPEPQRAWPEVRRDALRFYASVARYVALGGLLAAPYLFQFYGEFIRANDSRVGRGYRWSLGFSDTCGAALGSLFRPLSADVHGAFGGSALWAATALLPLALVTRKPLPRSALIAWSWAALVFLVSLGKATILHRLMWQFVPLANSFRVPGRITMLLPLPLSLAWVAVMHEPAGEGPWWRRRSLVLGVAGVIALLAFNYGLAPSLPPPTNFTPVRFNALPPWVMPMMTAGGVAALLALAATGARRVGRWARAALCVAVVA